MPFQPPATRPPPPHIKHAAPWDAIGSLAPEIEREPPVRFHGTLVEDFGELV
jgi:hypothetical protein